MAEANNPANNTRKSSNDNNSNKSIKQQNHKKRRGGGGRRRVTRSDSEKSLSSNESSGSGKHQQKHFHSYKKPQLPQHSQFVAMDCEMVGTMSGQSVAARVVLINWKGEKILDAYVKPNCPVTDYRTFVSGITEQQLQEYGQPLQSVRRRVQALIRGKVLVGHALYNDLQCLHLDHPRYMQRDTAYYEPFMQVRPTANGPLLLPRKLKDLTTEKLGRDIQVPGRPHCPTEDALAALDLYKGHRPRWEKCLRSAANEFKRAQQEQFLLQQQQHQELLLRQQQVQLYHLYVNHHVSTVQQPQIRA